MRIGDVIYDNDTVLIASASFNKEEPCKECFFYDGHECQSNRYIECWDKSINKDLIMIPFENNKVQDSKMMDHSSKTVTSKTGKDLLSALSRLSSITGDETNDMADTASRTLFSSLRNIYHSIDGIKIVKSEDGKLRGVGRMPRHLRT